MIILLAVFSLVLWYFLFSGRLNGSSSTIINPTEASAYVPTNVWASLLELTPVSYTIPHPTSSLSPLDGTYIKNDPAWPQWWSCLRCADYRPAGGVWRLQFDGGVMRIYYEVTGWSSLASYTVSGDRLFIFNDPYCKDMTGEYQWEMENGNLALEALQDSCSFQLRARNLSRQPWETCETTDASQKPRGCEDPVVGDLAVLTPIQGIDVTVHQGDVRLFSGKPDVFVHASGTDDSIPENIIITFSETSILYGNNRVLWTEDDWMEVKTDFPFTSVGVQFRGDYVIGWARVLFDGEEIWQGDTSRIWADLKIHGGYVEVLGFEPGKHILRVERLSVDSRPVVVAFFGFNEQGSVQK